MSALRLLCVDLDAKLIAQLQRELPHAMIRSAAHLPTLWAADLLLPTPDIIVLNLSHLNAADMQHYEALRAATQAPLMVLVEPRAAHMVDTLGPGMTDYLTLPAAASDLARRIRLIAQRAQQGRIVAARSVLTLGELTIDRHARLVRRGQKEIPLSALDWDILEVLIQANGASVTADVLLARVWKQPGSTNTTMVRMAIRRLRQKIEPDKGDFRYICSDPNDRARGYWLALTDLVPSEPAQSPEQRFGLAARKPFWRVPRLRTPFVDRPQELELLAARLRAVPMVTLIGPAGVGKTTLSVAVVEHMRDAFPGGVVFVPLAPLTRVDLVVPAIARMFDIADTQESDPIAAIATALQDYPPVLLILDNLEHLLGAATQISQLLDAAPQLSVLATSRTWLHTQGEHLVPINPLPLPSPDEAARSSLAELRQHAALRLFEQAAQAVNPHFRLTLVNGPTVAAICARLDGLPLAIELAAAQIRTFSPNALYQRLSKRLDTLADGPVDATPRQRTLRGAIAWSYELLSATERQLFVALGLFADGCTPAAAAAICYPLDEAEASVEAAGADVIGEGLATLHRHSLIVRLGDGDGRVMMLETIREFALEQLALAGWHDSFAARHCAYYHRLVITAMQHWDSPEHAIWAQRLDADYANIRIALQWAHDQQPELFVSLCNALRRFWALRGYLREGQSWLMAAVQHAAPISPYERARLLNNLGVIMMSIGDRADAQHVLEESLALRVQGNDQEGIADTVCNLGVIAEERGAFDQARQHYTQSLTLYRSLGNMHAVADVLNNLGGVADTSGDDAQAEMLFRESLALYEQLNATASVADSLNNIAQARRNQGDLAEAQVLLERCLALRRTLGDMPGTALTLLGMAVLHLRRDAITAAESALAESLHLYQRIGQRKGQIEAVEAIADLLAHQQRWNEATYLLTSAVALRAREAFARTSADEARYGGLARQLAQQIGAEPWAQAQRAGLTVTIEAVVAFALTHVRPPLTHEAEALRALEYPPSSSPPS